MQIPKRFEITRTPEIEALIDKYTQYEESYVLGETEAQIMAVMPYLSEWERVVLFVYTECKSVRKFENFFGISHWMAQRTIEDIKDKVKDLVKKQKI